MNADNYTRKITVDKLKIADIIFGWNMLRRIRKKLFEGLAKPQSKVTLN